MNNLNELNPTTSDLLRDCLNQFEALNNAGTYRHSQALRDRLRAALNLPIEPAPCEDCSGVPGTLCVTCGNFEEPTFNGEVY